MSLTINTSGGGGGSIQPTDGLVRIIADYGSSVSVTAGGTSKTLKSLPIVGDSSKSCYYDIVKPGGFSSTARSYSATLGSDSTSDSVVVNAAGEYTKELSYWNGELYLNGNQYTAHTGGWVSKNVRYAETIPGTSYYIAAVYPTLDLSGSTMIASVTTSGTDNNSGSVITANKVDLTDYDSVTFTLNLANTGAIRNVICYVTDTDDASGSVFTHDAQTSSSTTGDLTLTVDVSSLSGEYYVGFNIWAGGYSNTTATVTSIILS
jgi:hypothetical protein